MARAGELSAELDNRLHSLEASVAKLSQALQTWRSWEAEYEALKAEIDDLPPPTSASDLARIREGFDGFFVSSDEVHDILGRTEIKPADQIVRVLSGRLEIAAKNANSVEKMLDKAKEKLAIEKGDEELPIIEIREYLDDDDNVVSYELLEEEGMRRKTAQTLEAALGKAGMEATFGKMNVPQPKSVVEPSSEVVAANASQSPSTAEQATPPETKPEAKVTPKSRAAKKGVSFAEDTKPGDHGQLPSAQNQRTAHQLDELLAYAAARDGPQSSQGVTPEDELRDRIAAYRDARDVALNEMNPIVAELCLEEGSDSDDFEDDEEDEDEDGLEEDWKDEDEHGKSKYSAINAKYRQRMKDLEERLGLKDLLATDEHGQPATPTYNEGIGRATIPSGPEGQAMAEMLVEREITAGAAEPVELDANLPSQEPSHVGQRRGGAIKQEEASSSPVDGDKETPRRVSRFKAARLSKQQ